MSRQQTPGVVVTPSGCSKVSERWMMMKNAGPSDVTVSKTQFARQHYKEDQSYQASL
jgi:hypothetical protein